MTVTPNTPTTPDLLSQPIAATQRDHLVQFYRTPNFLYSAVGRFAGKGLSDGDGIVIIATRANRAGVRKQLKTQGFDVRAAESTGQLVLLDAAATLDRFMSAGMPDAHKFREVVGALVADMAHRYPRVRAYGEMVNLLWSKQNLAGTIALEELWNELAKTHSFTLLCGYHMNNFGDAAHDHAFHQVCHTHSHVISAHDFEVEEIEDPNAQRRTIAALQQQARVLQTEIAERKKIERALHDALHQLSTERARFEAVLRQMPAGVVIVDASNSVILANEQVAKMFRQALPGDQPAAFYEDGRRYTADEWPLTRSLTTGEVVNAEEMAYLRGDESRGTLAVSSAPIRDASGQIVAAVATFSEVTEQRQVQAERVKASRLESVGVLAAGIAHDFNNILTAILGNVSLAKLLNVSPSADDALSQAEQASVRARDLTQQLLTFAKGGAPVKRVGAVGDFLRETAAFTLRGANVRLSLDIADDLAPATFDAGQMSQVINNLLINAMQAMPSGGALSIAARNTQLAPSNPYQLPSGHYLQIKVSDRGVGIAPECLHRIFDPYFTTKKSGTGLGLATSYSIIKRHDGYIGVESQPHKGATFTVLLPACAREVVATAAPVVELRAGCGRVLLMDDELAVSEVGAALLRRLGYEVTIAADGAEALAYYSAALAENRRFDLVLLDLTVPSGMGGKECLEKIRAIDPSVKAVVSSGYSTDPIMADHTRHHFVGVIAKPYRLHELSDTVYKVLQ